MSTIKNFNDWSELNENDSRNANQEPSTLKMEMEDHIDRILDSSAEQDEIDSVKSGYAAIMKELGGNENSIICLTIPAMSDGYILGGDIFPQINVDDEVDTFDKYYALPKEGEKIIWEDQVWKNTPGGNEISSFTIDGVKLCEWGGSGYDQPWIYVNSADLK